MNRILFSFFLTLAACSASKKHLFVRTLSQPAKACLDCNKVCLDVARNTGLYMRSQYVLHAEEALLMEMQNSLSRHYQVELYPQCSPGSMLVRIASMDVRLDYSGFFWPVLGWTLKVSLSIETYLHDSTSRIKAESDYIGQVRQDFSMPPLEEAAITTFPSALQQATGRSVELLMGTSKNQ